MKACRAEGARHPRKRQLHRDHVQDVALRREQGLRRPGLAERARRQGLRRPDARLDDPARPDPAFNQSIADFTAKIDEAAAGIDDERFTMRYQTYVLRLLNPSQVFSSMLAGFKAAKKDDKIVGVNIVGQESQMVSMRDYTLHMKMFRFLKSVYPDVKVALHAGELALGDVPPEGLQFHIDQALDVAGADRIGHGIDLAHETNAAGHHAAHAREGHPGRDQPDLERLHQRREGREPPGHPVPQIRRALRDLDRRRRRHPPQPVATNTCCSPAATSRTMRNSRRPRTTASATPSCRPPTRRA
jgi:hypothetical protein